MKTMVLLSLYIKNFKGCVERTIDFNEILTIICGANGTGKTTVYDAIQWLFNGTNSLGASDKSSNFCRPRNDGGLINNVDVIVTGTYLIDGQTVQFTKIQKQKWTRIRGTDQTVLKGNENSYQINGVDKKEKDFIDYINSIIDTERFKLLTDIDYFINLPNEDQKGKKGKMSLLLELCGDVSDEDILNSDPEKWSVIADDVLTLGTRDAITKAKREKSASEKAEKEIPARIDEVSRQIKTVPDVQSLVAKQNDITAQIADLNSQLSEISGDDATEVKEQLVDAKNAVKSYEVEARRDIVEMKADAEKAYSDAAHKATDKEFAYHKLQGKVAEIERQISAKTSERNVWADTWKKTKNEVPFDHSQGNCPTCGQVLPKAMLNEAVKRHKDSEEQRKERHAEAYKNGMALKEEIEQLEAQKSEIIKQVEFAKEEMDKLNQVCNTLHLRIGEIKVDVDLSEDTKYLELKGKEIELSQMLDVIYKRQQDIRNVKSRIIEANNDLSIVTKQIAEAEQTEKHNESIKARIEELNEEHRNIGQNIADAERKIILLEEFCVCRSKMLSERINSHFDVARFSLVDEYQSGGVNSAVHITENGVQDMNVNTGHLMLVCIDIIKTFQKHYDTYLPLFVDGAEALSSDNQPKLDSQLILLKVTDDPELKVVA